DAGYTYYPCIAHTVVDGVFDYKLTVTNQGNVPMHRELAIDILPYVGDTGVLLTGSQRGTAWKPIMNSEVEVSGTPAGATVTVHYSTSETPCTNPLTTGGLWSCGDWTTTYPGPATAAIGIDVVAADGTPIAAGASFGLHWTMQAPPTSPAVGSIAWNSFAFTGEPITTPGKLLPAAEPRQVGIDLANASVQVQKATTPEGSDGTFSFTLAPVGDAVGGGTETLTTNGGHGSTSAWSQLTPGGTYKLTEDATGDASAFVPGRFACVNSNDSGIPIGTTAVVGGVQFVAPANGVIVCSITNMKRPEITVSKTTIGGDGDFAFTLTGDGGSKQTVSTIEGSGSHTWGPAGLTPGGTYTLSETVQDGWVSEFKSCTGVTPTSSDASSVTFTAAAGAIISCGFTNTKRPAITVSKTAVGGDGDFAFTLAGDGGSGQTVTTTRGAGSYTWGPAGLTPGGTYTLSETVQPGWVSKFTSCTGVTPTSSTDNSVTFTAAAGADIDCAFTNSKQPTVTVHKTAVGGNGIFDFVLTQVDPEGLAPIEGTDETRQVDTSTEVLTASWGPAGLIPGATYRITETHKSRWISRFNGCFDGEMSISKDLSDQSGGTFVADAGADIRCDFTNTYMPPPPPTTSASTPPTTPTTSISVLPTSNSVTGVTTTTSGATIGVLPTSGGVIDVLPTSKTSVGNIAYTGVNAYGMALLALLLLGGGALVLTIGSVWRRKSRKH
ncbi:MAG: hypothetical protein ABI382_11415, partial [Nakamurella sp.]